jgi:hypothetical protein
MKEELSAEDKRLINLYNTQDVSMVKMAFILRLTVGQVRYRLQKLRWGGWISGDKRKVKP